MRNNGSNIQPFAHENYEIPGKLFGNVACGFVLARPFVEYVLNLALADIIGFGNLYYRIAASAAVLLQLFIIVIYNHVIPEALRIGDAIGNHAHQKVLGARMIFKLDEVKLDEPLDDVNLVGLLSHCLMVERYETYLSAFVKNNFKSISAEFSNNNVSAFCNKVNFYSGVFLS